MDFTAPNHQWTAAIVGFVITASLCIFGFLFQAAVRNGKVRVSDFGLPDAMAGTVFFTWLAAAALRSFKAPPHPLTAETLIQSGVLYLLIVVAIGGFLKFREINLVQMFGLARIAAWKLPLLAFGLLLAIMPLLGLATVITQKWLGPDPEPQEVVKFFETAVSSGDSRALWVSVVVGAVLAPLAEELIFRGYLYGLLKRYLGIIPGILLNTLLFAAMHGNWAALPSLCILAFGLTVAYEATGCLLLPIAIHALFNFSQFARMLYFPHLK